jgi:hypothetical protein
LLANNSFFRSKIGKILSITITQYFVFLAWIPFRVHDYDAMLYSMEKFILLDLQTEIIIPFISSNKFEISLIILFLVLHWYSFSKRNLIETITNLSLRRWALFLIIVVMAIILFYNGNPEDFIYFKF